MVTHHALWRSIDQLASSKNISLSKLSIKSGLSATCLNPSKRKTKHGKQRWISMQAVSKILTTTNTSFSEFAKIVEENARF